MEVVAKLPSLRVAAVLTGAALASSGATVAALASRHTATVVRTVTVNGTPASATTSSLRVGQIYKRAYRGVVEILVTSTRASPSPFGPEQHTQQAQGSG